MVVRTGRQARPVDDLFILFDKICFRYFLKSSMGFEIDGQVALAAPFG